MIWPIKSAPTAAVEALRYDRGKIGSGGFHRAMPMIVHEYVRMHWDEAILNCPEVWI